ncbi:MAG: hypothetical protein O7A68_06680 [Alphaproteobacteria bacterium]|nr:hypothetical protein [Alphaproteobacteria bacterium]
MPPRRPLGPTSTARAAYDEGDYVAARAQLEPLAQGGDAEAQYLMGLSYYHGSGALRDDARAAAWFRKAAARDHGYAMYALRLMHDLGRGVKRSHGAAMLWYRRAAYKGVQQAICELSRGGGGGPLARTPPRPPCRRHPPTGLSSAPVDHCLGG